MHKKFPIFLIICFISCAIADSKEPKTHPVIKTTDTSVIREIDLHTYYDEEHLDGMFVVYNPDTKVCYIYNKKFFLQPETPASTFNITTTLISLEEKILENEQSKIPFDGVHRSKYQESNQDMPLAVAFKKNVDWAFLHLRHQIGAARLKTWVNKLKFGNMAVPDYVDTAFSVEGKTDTFWVVPGTLKITPAQQLAYVQSLRNESLPFSKHTLQTVKKLMYLADTSGYSVYGKQGSYTLNTEGKYIGWHIGWIERNRQLYYYINYLQTPDLHHPTIANAQKGILYRILKDLDAIGKQ